MTSMCNAFKPAVLLGETHNPFRYERGVIADAVDRIADMGFYRAVELPDVPCVRDRRRIGRAAREAGLAVTQWMSNILRAENLDLSSVDESVRRKSVARMKDMIEPAMECEADTLAVLSGPDPGPELRSRATERLYQSLLELCDAACQVSSINVIIEPLDRDAHKNGLIGPTAEFVPLFERLQQVHPHAGVSWDTAHVALCGDDVYRSFSASRNVIRQIHLATAVLDPAHPDFGDHHLPVGETGFLTMDMIAGLFRLGVETGLFAERQPPVSVETRTLKGGDPWQTEANGRRVLERAWEICQAGAAT